jgi:DNA replication protein DnaC
MKHTQLNVDSLKDANIPKKFWKLNRSTYFGDADALTRTEKYVKGFANAHSNGVGLIYRGPAQSCKTFLATYVLRNLLAQGLNVAYYSMDELFELYVSGDSAGANFLSRFKEAHCVVIDNVGVSDKDKMGKRNALVKVITSRSDAGLPYVICTDLKDYDAIRENYGDKIEACFKSDLVLIDCSCSAELIRAKRNEAKTEFM